MVFWRQINAMFGELTIVGRGNVARIEESEVDGIRFALFPKSTSTPFFLLSLWKWLAAQEIPKIVWCSDAVVTPLVSLVYARKNKIPLFLELQGNYFQPPVGNSVKLLLARRLAMAYAHAANRVRVCADMHAQKLSLTGISSERIEVIPTRVDINLFDPGRYDRDALRNALGFADNESILIVGVGNLIRGKGFKHAIEALSDLPENVSLVLVGDGPEKDALQGLAMELSVADRVRFLGRKPHHEIAGVLSAGDIFILPSYSEGMPRVVNEAQAMQLPVVSTQIDGVIEQVVEGGTGFLCPPGQTEGLVTALKTLVENPELRQSMGRLGRARAVERYALDKVMRRWEDAISRALVS